MVAVTAGLGTPKADARRNATRTSHGGGTRLAWWVGRSAPAAMAWQQGRWVAGHPGGQTQLWWQVGRCSCVTPMHISLRFHAVVCTLAAPSRTRCARSASSASSRSTSRAAACFSAAAASLCLRASTTAARMPVCCGGLPPPSVAAPAAARVAARSRSRSGCSVRSHHSPSRSFSAATQLAVYLFEENV